jgi:glycosyltransferase involved in cell wall biosynthesis
LTRLSAVVPATDEPPTLEACLRGIREAAAPPEELIVVESAPGPGPAAARNEGATRATGDVLVFVDADVVPARDAFIQLREAFDADAELDGIFGAYDDEPAAPGRVSQFRNLLHHHVHTVNRGPAQTFWAGLGALRREAFVASGGFDGAAYPHSSIEDIELGLRLQSIGRRVVLDPTIRGKHLKRWTLAEMVYADFARRGLPWAQLVLERRTGSSALNLGWRHRLSAAASVAAVVSACSGRRRIPAGAVGLLLVLNADFYRLLLRRQGLSGAAVGIGLHVLHHLTGVAAAATAATSVTVRRLSCADC